VFAGSASKPVLEEAALKFEEHSGVKVELHFSGSGRMLSEMMMSKSGDIYIPGSPDFMEKAEAYGVVYPETEKILAYLIPAILVKKGNPKDIHTLKDLAREGIRVGIAEPESVCVGLYAVEILEKNNLLTEVGKNIITRAESCSKTASLLLLDSVDALIGWRIFEKWHPDKIEAIYLDSSQIPRIAYIPAAISVYTKNREKAEKFIEFLSSSEGKRIFRSYGYLASESEARSYAPEAMVGGLYQLSEAWRRG
jgi:molybdate transport system substrate-binding protein